ncbi:MAG TPA: 2-amino-4-hydroxy-6-hydroxymethyldihydropteridine diphosphokinase [Pirellulales bacterium]|jgi:2-amino-4-hydroxy-6-hydroxymethyldihydropteridine diphosphokinase|nr:2-amino-4-hydroxy-6-hydroxymethyldihydropteridine diphosphokinase [Pirellulales bacterium]
MARCLIGLGANLGDRQATLSCAVARLASTAGVTIESQSRWHETAPVGGPAGQAKYLNGALAIQTSLAPLAVFERLREIERDLGRRRRQRWGARRIDLDLLLYDQLRLEMPRLNLPHPRMAFRRFVLEPAAEVAADMVHPTSDWSIARLLAHLDESKPYVAITGLPGAGKTRLAGIAAREAGARLLTERPDVPAGAGPAEAMAEIERLSRRARLLSAVEWTAVDSWVVSDFWFDESLAWSAAWLDGPGCAAVAEAWHALRATVPAPRLLVVLDMPNDVTSLNPAERGVAEWDSARRGRWRPELVEQIRRSDQGPTCWLSAADAALARTELLAALAAMM